MSANAPEHVDLVYHHQVCLILSCEVQCLVCLCYDTFQDHNCCTSFDESVEELSLNGSVLPDGHVISCTGHMLN